MKKYKWPPYMPEMGNIVKEYIDKGFPLSIPDESGIIHELELSFAKLHGRKYGLAVSSGTMALYSVYFALDLKPGDEVICTAFSYHATAAPLLHLGVEIVFCDTEPDTGNIDISKIEALITNKTKAIVTNDQRGHPCDKDAVASICKKYSLKYIEDCSHAHFSEYNGKYVGSFGDAACWSLQGRKLLSGGEGGIILTDSREIYEKAVLLGHNLKRPAQSVKTKEYAPLNRTGYGLKLRMHPLAALMVKYQLDNFCFDWIKSRSETLAYFEEKLEDTFLMPMSKRSYVTSMGAWYGFMPRVREGINIDRQHFVKFMNDKGLQISIPKSAPIPDYELFHPGKFQISNYEKHEINDYSNAKYYYSRILNVPTFTFHEYDIIDKYAEAVKEYEKTYVN